MATSNGTVPTISIITEDDNSDSEYENQNMQEVHTDVEDLEFGNVEHKYKKILKVRPQRNEELTDIEDIETSDNEIEERIIEHDSPISVDQILESNEITYDEGFKLENSNERQRISIKQNMNKISTSALCVKESEHEFTDCEDLDASDEEEASEENISDTDLLTEIIQESEATNISDSIRQFLNKSHSPAVTPLEGLSENEFEKNSHLLTLTNSKGSQRLSPMTISPQLSDLTDIEILHSDSNDETEVRKPRHKRSKVKKHTPKENKLGVSDTEDLEVSDADDRKLLLKGYTLMTSKTKHGKPRNKSKHSNTGNLFIDLTDADPVTDTEELNFKTPDTDRIDFVDDKDDIVAVKVRRGKRSFKTEMFRKSKPERDDENYTDEECDMDITHEDDPIPDNADYDIKFVELNSNQPMLNKKKKIINKKNLNIVVEDTAILTDIEELNSSDDEIQRNCKEIPVVIIDKEDDTDTESIEGQPDISHDDFDIPNECIAKPVRQFVQVTEREENFPVVTVTPMDETNREEEHETDFPGTDVEDLSGDEEATSDVVYFKENVDNLLPEQGIISHMDQVKEYMGTIEDNDTDQEDLDLTSAGKKANCFLDINVPGSSTVKTDVEDLDTSDEDWESPRHPDMSVTPDMLRQMSGDVIIAKEGSTVIKREKRRKYSRQRQIANESDMQTDTDEMMTSADDELCTYARADTATPMQMKDEYNDSSSTKLYTESMKNLDLNTSEEVLYIKGGCYYEDTSDDFEQFENPIDSLTIGRYCVCDQHSQKKSSCCHVQILNNNQETEWNKPDDGYIIGDKESQVDELTSQVASTEAGNWQQSMAADQAKTNIDIMTVGKEQEKDDSSTEKGEQRTTSGPSTTQQREVADQHQLSSEMKDLLAEMEKQAKN